MDLSGLAGKSNNDWEGAVNILKGQGIQNPSSGLINWVRSGAQEYGLGEARQYGLPIKQSDLVSEQQELRKQAIAPALASYEASIPEITSKYQGEQTRLGAEKQPLIDRYQVLIDQLTGREQSETAAQAKVLANQYSQRGIALSSGIYQQDLTNKTQGISQTYAGLNKEAVLGREGDLREIDNLIATLTDQSVEAVRAVRSAMAQLQSGQAVAGIDSALSQYENIQQRQFESRFDPLQKKILEQQANPQPSYQVVEGKDGIYSFNPATGALSLLQKQLSGGTTGTAAERAKASTLTQYKSDVSSGRFSLGDLVFKYQDVLGVDEILSQYNQNSPYGNYRESTDDLKRMFGF